MIARLRDTTMTATSRGTAGCQWTRWFAKFLLGFVVGCLWSIVAFAEHPIDVQKLSAEGDHFKALTMYELLPDRRLDEDTHIAAARSAWALGMTKYAIDLFDTILRGDSLDPDERARITLSRGIIEYQEDRYQEAALFAEKAASQLPERAPLRGRAMLLWGQSLYKARAYSLAEEKLLGALADAAPSDRPDVALSLGNVLMKLGKLSEAEKSLKLIPASHTHAAEAIRMLARIAFLTKQGERARFWIERGRSDYTGAFLDSWADFGLVTVALESDDLPRARSIVERAQKRLPPSDNWLILMQAALEQAEWKGLAKGSRE
jgi:tetratricopeptide (TPR) repeat protein